MRGATGDAAFFSSQRNFTSPLENINYNEDSEYGYGDPSERFFGNLSKLVFDPNASYQQRTAQASYANRDNYGVFASILLGAIATDNNYFFHEYYGLPIIKDDKDHYVSTVIKYNKSILEMNPEQAPPRTLIGPSISKSSTSTTRRGGQFTMTTDFAQEKAGVDHFARSFLQLKFSAVWTFEVMIIDAVSNIVDLYHQQHFGNINAIDTQSFIDMVEAQNTVFMCAQKSGSGLRNNVMKAKNALIQSGFTPTTVWLRSDDLPFARGTGKQSIVYSEAGPRGPETSHKEPRDTTSVAGVFIQPIRDYDPDTGEGHPFAPLTTTAVKGQYYIMFGKPPNLIDPKQYRSSDRDIFIYGSTPDRFVPISIKDVLDKSNLFPDGEDDHPPSDRLWNLDDEEGPLPPSEFDPSIPGDMFSTHSRTPDGSYKHRYIKVCGEIDSYFEYDKIFKSMAECMKERRFDVDSFIDKNFLLAIKNDLNNKINNKDLSLIDSIVSSPNDTVEHNYLTYVREKSENKKYVDNILKNFLVDFEDFSKNSNLFDSFIKKALESPSLISNLKDKPLSIMYPLGIILNFTRNLANIYEDAIFEMKNTEAADIIVESRAILKNKLGLICETAVAGTYVPDTEADELPKYIKLKGLFNKLFNLPSLNNLLFKVIEYSVIFSGVSGTYRTSKTALDTTTANYTNGADAAKPGLKILQENAKQEFDIISEDYKKAKGDFENQVNLFWDLLGLRRKFFNDFYNPTSYMTFDSIITRISNYYCSNNVDMYFFEWVAKVNTCLFMYDFLKICSKYLENYLLNNDNVSIRMMAMFCFSQTEINIGLLNNNLINIKNNITFWGLPFFKGSENRQNKLSSPYLESLYNHFIDDNYFGNDEKNAVNQILLLNSQNVDFLLKSYNNTANAALSIKSKTLDVYLENLDTWSFNYVKDNVFKNDDKQGTNINNGNNWSKTNNLIDLPDIDNDALVAVATDNTLKKALTKFLQFYFLDQKQIQKYKPKNISLSKAGHLTGGNNKNLILFDNPADDDNNEHLQSPQSSSKNNKQKEGLQILNSEKINEILKSGYSIHFVNPTTMNITNSHIESRLNLSNPYHLLTNASLQLSNEYGDNETTSFNNNNNNGNRFVQKSGAFLGYESSSSRLPKSRTLKRNNDGIMVVDDEIKDFLNSSTFKFYIDKSRSIVDKEVARYYVSILFCTFSRRFLYSLIDNDIPLPLGFIIPRPGPQLATTSATVGAFNRQAGFFAVSKVDVASGTNVSDKVITVNLTVKSAPVIVRPDAIIPLDHIRGTKVFSGLNTTFYTKEDAAHMSSRGFTIPNPRSIEDISSLPSMMVIPTLYGGTKDMRSTIDVTGLFFFENASKKKPHFITTRSYYKVWDFQKIDSTLRIHHPLDPRSRMVNTICSQAKQFCHSSTSKNGLCMIDGVDFMGNTARNGWRKGLVDYSGYDNGVYEAQSANEIAMNLP